MEIPVFVQSLKSSILCSTSFQSGKTFWGVASAAVEQSRRKAYVVAKRSGEGRVLAVQKHTSLRRFKVVKDSVRLREGLTQ